ncbi:MAG: ATP-binding protein [Streptosporangiaceae bacterium]
MARELADCAGEALRNVTRHAGTDEAEIRVRSEGDCVLVEIRDRGRGFDLLSVPGGGGASGSPSAGGCRRQAGAQG